MGFLNKIFNKQLTVEDLLDIDEGRVRRSENLGGIRLIKTLYATVEDTWFSKFTNFFRNKPREFYYFVDKYKIQSDSGKEYVTFIKVSPSFEFNKFLSNKVHVFCSCPDFKFRAAYNLSKKENVFLNKGTIEHLGKALTEPPTKVVPTNICKHLYATIHHFKKNINKSNFVK